MAAEGKDVIRLGFGQSPFPAPECMQRELREHAWNNFYQPVKGVMALRNQIAEHFEAVKGIPATGEDVMVGPGSKQLIFLMQMAINCELIVPRPCWVSYVPQAELLGRSVRYAETSKENGWQLTAEELDRVCLESKAAGFEQRIFILNNPCNPHGMVTTEEYLRGIGEVAERHNLIVLADEIYDHQQHDGRHVPLRRFYPQGTVTLVGLSKWAGVGGWRTGAFVFPPEMRWLMDGMAILASETHSSASGPIQFASIPGYTSHLDTPDGLEMRAYIKGSRITLALLASAFANIFHSNGYTDSIVPGTGGFYSWLDFDCVRPELNKRGIMTSPDLAAAVLNEIGVAFLPGTEYGWPAEKLCLHTAIVDFDGGAAIKAANEAFPEEAPEWRLSEDTAVREKQMKFLEDYTPRVLEGARRVVQWLPEVSTMQ